MHMTNSTPQMSIRSLRWLWAARLVAIVPLLTLAQDTLAECDDELKRAEGECERQSASAMGDCGNRCSQCDAAADACDRECGDKCRQCNPGFSLRGCLDDCNN